MDGFSTFVLNYQDVTGNVFTSRIITNNPEPLCDSRARLAELYRTFGYVLLSADRIEEVGGTGSVMGEGPCRDVRVYRGIILGSLLLSIGHLFLDTWQTEQASQARDQLVARTEEIFARLDFQDRQFARIENRQLAPGADLEKLEGHHR
jgi:hypothetical protein